MTEPGRTGRTVRGRHAGASRPRPAGRGAAGRREPAGRVDPARQAAYEAVAAVHRDDAYANLVLPQILREQRPARAGTRRSPPS